MLLSSINESETKIYNCTAYTQYAHIDLKLGQWLSSNAAKICTKFIATWVMWLWFQMCKFLKHNFGINIYSIQVNKTLEWMPENPVDDNSVLVQIRAWCH